MDYNRIYEAAFAAFKKAIEETGDAYKKMSWFGKNKSQQPTTEKDNDKSE
jgi:hypothetical protein